MMPGSAGTGDRLTLFLCGDVMTGRAIDQVLPFSVDPQLYEPYVKDARDYVRLAEKKNGPIPSPVDYRYVWGDALEVWQEEKPDLRLINLETSITLHAEPWHEKIVQYRMHPENTTLLTAAGISFCSLANNHVLDWDYPGLQDTMQALREAGIAFAGAGQNKVEAHRPAVFDLEQGRVVVLAYGAASSGIPPEWAATASSPGINLLPDLSHETVLQIAGQVKEFKRPGDVVVFSVHWGGNWGYDIAESQRSFAHQLLDEAGIDLVIGHSSHHPLGLEVYKGKLIVYGAGDYINDYEGISGHEQFRSDLTLMYFPQLKQDAGELVCLKMVPMQLRNFRLNLALRQDALWLAGVMKRECLKLGTDVLMRDSNLYVYS